MSELSIYKIFEFEAAHLLENHFGKCKNIHGHSYKLEIGISGIPNPNNDVSDSGMIMDFGELKKIVKENIIDLFDHSLIVHKNSLLAKSHNFPSYKIIYTEYHPTCEMMVLDFVNILKDKLPENVKLSKVRLYETSNSYCEWQ